MVKIRRPKVVLFLCASCVYLIIIAIFGCKVLPINFINCNPSAEKEDSPVMSVLESHMLASAPIYTKCLGSTLYAAKYGGGLGNVMFELLGFYALAQRVERAAVVHENYLNDKIHQVSKIFPNVPSFFFDAETSNCDQLKLLDVTYRGCCTFDQNIIDTISSKKDQQAVTVNLFYLQSYKFFNNLPSHIIRRFFTAANHVQKAAEHIFEDEPKINALNICVHIRRGDFTNSTQSHASDKAFTVSAVDYVLKKAAEEDSRLPYIYVMSDDVAWANRTFKAIKRVSIALSHSYAPPGTEWEFSRRFCDRVLLTASVSTYGYWIAYHSRGQKVYYNRDYSYNDGIEKQMVATDFWPTHWIAVEYDAVKNRVVEYMYKE